MGARGSNLFHLWPPFNLWHPIYPFHLFHPLVMTDILRELTTLRREDAELRKLQVPEAEMFRRARAAAPAPDFIAAFRNRSPAIDDDSAGRVAPRPPRIIAELKKASPSEGLIRADFEPRSLALELAHAGAAALSVLCEPHRFLGSEAYLREAVAALGDNGRRPSAVSLRSAMRTSAPTCDRVERDILGAAPIPVLYKDFVTTPYQVAAARAAGASAVLLIVAALDDATLRELLRVVHDLGFAALVETHDADEIRRAVAAGARVIGVNCRDLRTFKTDPAIVERLIGEVPRECVRIAESGIRSAGDIARLRAAGADGFLVGTTLMRAERPGETLKDFIFHISDFRAFGTRSSASDLRASGTCSSASDLRASGTCSSASDLRASGTCSSASDLRAFGTCSSASDLRASGTCSSASDLRASGTCSSASDLRAHLKTSASPMPQNSALKTSMAWGWVLARRTEKSGWRRGGSLKTRLSSVAIAKPIAGGRGRPPLPTPVGRDVLTAERSETAEGRAPILRGFAIASSERKSK
jgi:indole-3-glycerol phosphate synthase